MGLHAGNVASFAKSAIASSVGSMGKRAKRHAWRPIRGGSGVGRLPIASAPTCRTRRRTDAT
jgi:hypothetical protein